MLQPLVKRSAETTLFDINCQMLLGPGETITAVLSTTAEGAGSALTFGAASINTANVVYDYARNVAPGKIMQLLIGGGSNPTGAAGTMYTVRVLFSTSNPGETREATVALLVIDTP